MKIFIKFNKNNRFYFPKFIKLYEYLKNKLPDLIILRNYNKIFGLLVIIISKFLGIKIVFYEQLDKIFLKNKLKLLFFSIRNYILNSKFYTPIFNKFEKIYFIINFLCTIFSRNKKKE